jgi:phosphohistidine phosphatase SixA
VGQLPTVTQETGFAVCHELERSEYNEYVIRLLERVEQENPCVAEFVSRLAIQHDDPVGISTAAMLVYRLLESQAEADGLRAQLETGTE